MTDEELIGGITQWLEEYDYDTFGTFGGMCLLADELLADALHRIEALKAENAELQKKLEELQISNRQYGNQNGVLNKVYKGCEERIQQLEAEIKELRKKAGQWDKYCNLIKKEKRFWKEHHEGDK